MSDYNNLFSFDRISAKDIAKTITKELAPFYPSGDENALVLAAIKFYERKDQVDSLGAAEPNFDKAELLIPQIKKKLIEFDKLNYGEDKFIPVQPITIDGDAYDDENMYKTNYSPLILLFEEYETMFNIKKTDDDKFIPLNADFQSDIEKIINFVPKIINYSKDNAAEKVEFVKNGLQNNTAEVRDAFVNDTFKLLDREKKISYQGIRFSGWLKELKSLEPGYHKILAHEAMIKDCQAKIERLGSLKYNTL